MTMAASAIIRAYNTDREPERLALKMTAMRGGVFPFLRGTAHLFWQRVHEAGLPMTAPLAWCSGDLHLENFGTYRGDNTLTYFDINDFDEAALAPCNLELLRFLTSLVVAAPTLRLEKAETRALAKLAAETYRSELVSAKARWLERRTVVGAIDDLMGGLKKRSQKRLLDRRTIEKKGQRRLDPKNARLLAASDADKSKLERFCKLLGKKRHAEDFFAFRDAARRIAGTGSLGVMRYVVLVEGFGSPDGNVLLDVKGTTPSSLAAIVKGGQPAWDGEADRIVSVQRRCQAVAPALLTAETFDGQDVVLKELQPTADRLDLGLIANDKHALADVVRSMACLTAWAQIRSTGRSGSATADDLLALGATDGGFAGNMYELSRAMADVTSRDYDEFCRTYDAEKET